MRVLITGAAGFLGRYFYQAHVAAGDEVLGIDNMSGQYTDEGRWGLNHVRVVDAIAYFEGTRRNEKFDLAYHFAAPVGGRLKIEGDPLFNAHSLALDEAFFRWAIKHTTQAVYPSSSAVYGAALQKADARALAEGLFFPGYHFWWKPDEMYGFTKMAGEMLAWTAEKYGLRTLCIRPFSGYGERQSFEYPVPSIAARALRREDPLVIWGSGKQARDFIHVDDLVRLTRLARPDGYASLNLGSGHPTTFREVAELCADIVGYKPEIVSDESKPEGVTTRYADIARQRELSEQPLISLRAGLTRVLEEVDQRLSAAVI